MKHVPPKLGPIRYGDFSLDLEYYLGGDYVDIIRVASELPAAIEWVNAALQDWTERKIIAKQFVEQVEATVYFELKNGGFEAKGYAGKPSEDAVKHAIQLDERVTEAHRKYAVLYAWVQRLYNVQGSLQARLDLVRSSEATRRRLTEDPTEENDQPSRKHL